MLPRHKICFKNKGLIKIWALKLQVCGFTPAAKLRLLIVLQAPLSAERARQQAIHFPFGYGVAFADPRFEPRPVVTVMWPRL